MFLSALGVRPIDFPELPPAPQIALGRAVYRRGAGIDRTLFEDRATLGTWFDGRIRRAVDTATWVSPSLVARWYGYLAERDGWSDEVIARRWADSRKRLDGRLTYVVRLAAFPRLDPLEFGIGAPPRPETIKGVRFRLSFAPPARRFHIPAAEVVASTLGTCAAAFEKEDPAPVTGRAFFSLTELAPLFLADGEADEPDDGIPLGEYYGAVYVASFPVVPAMRSTKSLKLTVQLPSKREHAEFQTRELLWTPQSRVPDEE